jgi:hypothetical protein
VQLQDRFTFTSHKTMLLLLTCLIIDGNIKRNIWLLGYRSVVSTFPRLKFQWFLPMQHVGRQGLYQHSTYGRRTGGQHLMCDSEHLTRIWSSLICGTEMQRILQPEKCHSEQLLLFKVRITNAITFKSWEIFYVCCY